MTILELTQKKMGALAWSDQQYRGSRLDFYDRMNSLSSPRPVEVSAQLNALIEALHESARRRVLSVDNGENWIKTHRKRRMKMPSGYAIFQTAGPWEDFATPSRDMRLLIALDTVLDLPKAFTRNPQRFGVQNSDLFVPPNNQLVPAGRWRLNEEVPMFSQNSETHLSTQTLTGVGGFIHECSTV